MEVTDDEIDALGEKNVNVTISYEVHLMKKNFFFYTYRPTTLYILKIYILYFVGENRKLSESIPSNLCTSLSDWKRRTKAKTTQQTEITSKRSECGIISTPGLNIILLYSLLNTCGILERIFLILINI